MKAKLTRKPKRTEPAAPAKKTDVRPDWFVNELARPLQDGTASVFIVHGDVNCLVRNPDVSREPDVEYVPIKKFFEKVLDRRELVLNYNLAPGLWTMKPSMEAKFRQVANLDPPPGATKADPAADPVAAAKAKLQQKRDVPREPEACFPLIEKALRSCPNTALIVESAHAVLPATGAGGVLPANERALVERVKIWARSTVVRKNNGMVLLFTDQASKVNGELRLPDCEVKQVFIPKPDKAERRSYISWQVRMADDPIRFDASLRNGRTKVLDVDVLAHATQGMSLRQINEIFVRATSDDEPLSLAFVKDKKRELLNQEYGDVMEVVEPERGLEDIGGHDHIKGYFRGVLTAITNGENRLVPMGVTLMGPPGTGKTAIVEALAKEAGYNFVKAKNIRSMWVGESEQRMEKFTAGLRALAPVVVMNDEADLAEAGRDTQKGDSGVSERLMKAWMELLSDPRIRGQIIVINCTNRPDRIDAALKRSGRSDQRIAMLMPSEEDRAAIYEVMFKRHRLPYGIKDFTSFAKAAPSLSGADIEAVVLSSFSIANGEGKKKIDDESLQAAIDDFIPSNNQTEIDGMSIAGLLECSSRRLLPPHVVQVVEGIVLRDLVPNINEVIGKLRDRGILPRATKPAAEKDDGPSLTLDD